MKEVFLAREFWQIDLFWDITFVEILCLLYALGEVLMKDFEWLHTKILKIKQIAWFGVILYCGAFFGVYRYLDGANHKDALIMGLAAALPFVFEFFIVKPINEFESRAIELRAYSDYLHLSIANSADYILKIRNTDIRITSSEMFKISYNTITLKDFCNDEFSVFSRAMQIEVKKRECVDYVDKGNVDEVTKAFLQLLIMLCTTQKKVVFILQESFGIIVPISYTEKGIDVVDDCIKNVIVVYKNNVLLREDAELLETMVEKWDKAEDK